jgi:Na+/H+-translocating membrane pyrophosphatase
MITFIFFPWWFWGLPLVCIASIVTGIWHITHVYKGTLPPDDSIEALSSFIYESLLVFLKKQLIFIGITILAITIGSVGLQFLHLHHMMLSILIVWGVIWSTGMGVSTLLWTAQLTGKWVQLGLSDPQKWQAQIRQIGWARTLIPMGILMLDLWIWITVLYESVHHNWLRIGTHLMESAGVTGAWSASAMSVSTLQPVIDREISLIVLAYGFGSIIQTFLIGITTQTMMTSSQRANEKISLGYPDIRPSDLRNPASMATLVGEITTQTWGQISQMTALFLVVILSGIAIGVSAFREDGTTFGSHLMLLPLLLIGFGLVGGIVASLITRPTTSQQISCTSLVMALLAGVATSFGIISLHYLIIVLGSIVLAGCLAILQTWTHSHPDFITGRLEKFALALGGIIAWMAFNFIVARGHAHVLLGLNGMSVGAVTVMAVGLPFFSSSHTTSLKGLAMTYATVLGVDTDLTKASRNSASHTPSDHQTTALFTTILGTVSTWIWFFIFLDATPHWLAKIQNSVVIDRFATALAALTHITLTGNSHKYLIDHLSFSEIDLILGISPTNPFFGFGLIGSIGVGIGIGIVWMRSIRRITRRIVTDANTQLEENPDIQLGLALPSYREAIGLVTRASFMTSISIFGALVISTLTLGMTIGLGGLSGILLGSILLSLMIGIAQATDVKDDLRTELRIANLMMMTATQTLLLFSILFGSLVLQFFAQ